MSRYSKILLACFFLIFSTSLYFFYKELDQLNASFESNQEEQLNKIKAINSARFNSERRNLELEKEINDLRNQIVDLSKKLDSLEKNTYKVEIGKSVPNVKWMKLENWRKIRAGMYEDSVINILGEPTRRSAFSGQVTLSYNGYGKSASVTVGPMLVGVVSWNEPR